MPADPDRQSPRIWVLLGLHRGDNNQVLALAEALRLPFETKQLSHRELSRSVIPYYNDLRRLILRWPPTASWGLNRRSRTLIAGEPPDLIISIGYRGAAIARGIRKRSGGRTLTVQLGNPRVSPRHFDLVITTPQYPVPPGPNVAKQPIALGRALEAAPDKGSARFLADARRPLRLLLLGGPTTNWTLEPDDVRDAIGRLLRASEADQGSLVVLGSARTPVKVLRATEEALASSPARGVLAPIEGPPSYAAVVGSADMIFVSADSVSMISEALRADRPVGLLPVRPTEKGKMRMARHDLVQPGRPLPPRDLRYFWMELERLGLVGTIDRPVRGDAPDVVARAAALVTQLLRLSSPPATDGHGSAA